METMPFNCPACGQSIEAPAEIAGQSVQCPTCGHEFVVPARSRRWKTGLVIVAAALAGTACLASIILWQHQSKRPAAAQIHAAKQPPSELKQLQEQATKGDSKARVALGKRYLNGDGVATNWVEAVNWFRKAAEQGDPQGQVALGRRYYHGQGVATNWVEAAKWWQRAAEKGDAEAILAISIAYYNGDGVTQDRDRSLKLLIKSAEQGNAEAQYLLAGTYDYNRGPPHLFYSLPIQVDKPQATNWYARALRSYTLQAEGGDAQAQLRVGQCCKNIAELALPNSVLEGVGPDGNPIRVAGTLKENPEAARLLEQAFKWFKKAAEQGKPDAQLLLARAYKYGEGVQTNAPEAIRWYTKAAEQGDEEAPSELGSMYEDGQGVDKDVKRAAEWYIKAVERGDTMATTSLRFILEERLTNDAQPLVLEWFLKSARKGSAEAQSEVADYYMASPSAQDKVEAAKWYSKAAEQSDPHAQAQLGYIYKDGKGVEKDAKEAFRWFLSAHQILEQQSRAALEISATNRDRFVADLEMSQSQLKLSMMGPLEFQVAEAYQTGVGTFQDKEEAFKWYLRAAQKGERLAQAKVGGLYWEQGTNSAENRIEAHKWLSLAAAQGVEDAAKARDTLARKMTLRELAEAFSERPDYRGVAPGQDPITFTNKIVTFTNLQGRAYRDVRLVRADLDGIIYREEGASGGRVCYTNLSAAVLESFGIPTNRVAAAKARADNAAALQRPAQPTEADRKKFEETKAQAEKGDARAQWSLALAYELGAYVTKDAVEAVKWFRKAAEQGDTEAQCTLGYDYEHGEGVTKDAVESAKWYRKAAEQGRADAQFNLGLDYYRGDGVAKDAVEAVKWFRKAAEQGDAKAQYALGLCYVAGSGVAEDADEAVKWFRKAAEQGDAKAQFKLGCSYYNGDGVTKDADEAVKWFRKAAEQGDQLAQDKLTALGRALETLSLTNKVMEKNDTWWRWSYQLKVRNSTDQPIHEFPHLLFLDAEGFVIEEETCQVKLSAGETKTVLGTTLVRLPGAAKVKTVKVK